MGQDQVHAFAEKAKSDSALQEKLKEMPQGPESLNYVVNVAKEAGYDFTTQELEEASKQKAGSGEISQEDLDKISGGTFGIITVIVQVTLRVC